MMRHLGYTIIYTIFTFVLLSMVVYGQQKDIVNGNLIQFNDNGFWCWYQDERAVIDAYNGKLIVASAASGFGLGGSPRNADLDAVIFDLKTGISQRSVLMDNGGGALGSDDHNAPALLVLPNHKYLSIYAGHNNNKISYYRIYDGSVWGAQQTFDWNAKISGGSDFANSYSNVYYLSSEERTYNFSRSNKKSPNFMISSDMGNTWSYGGQLTTGTGTSYNNGYYKYWSNGVDRIDFIFTEAHPRDTLTSIYHGYIQGGKSYKSDGTLIDSNIFDNTYIPTYHNYTRIFTNATNIESDTLFRCWQADFVRYDDGVISVIITARINQSISYGYPDNNVNPDHAFILCRFNGMGWSHSFLAKAGQKMYSSEADYTGLAALCPNDPNTLYISTPYSPIDTSLSLGVREIWKGTTSNHGANWTWTPITENSTRDNFRPIVPLWDNNNTALLWCRGTYSSAQNFDAAVVGILNRTSDIAGLMTYVDANTTNTTLSSGDALTTTGPDANPGAADNNWHQRTGIGNGSTLFTSAESGNENAPTIRTRINAPSNGIFDVWVNFWAESTSNWRIKAGLSASEMQIFRSMASKQIQNGDHNTSLTLASGGASLYQAYVGRVNALSGSTIDVYIDDEASSTTTRTLYDGISYTNVTTVSDIAFAETSIDFGLVMIGSAKKDSILIYNTGTADLQITAISSTNARFTFAPAAITLAPSTSSYLAVTFAPENASFQAGSIILTHNAAGSPDTITVGGEGSSAPMIALSGTSIDFGTVTIGLTKKDSIQVSNPGTSDLQITAISSSNTRFTFTPATISLAPLGRVYLAVTFAPQDASAQSGSIILTHNASSSPDTILVNGIGSIIPEPILALSKTSINFGVITIGSTKIDSVLVSNSGTDTLRVSTILSSNHRYSFTPATMTLAPSGNAYLVVTFAAQDTSSQSGSIVLTHNALGSPDTVSLNGKGSLTVGVDRTIAQLPTEFSLSQNYPNPFNPTTQINYSIPKDGYVSLKVYNLLGKEIVTLFAGVQHTGNYTARFNGAGFASGVYLYRLQSQNVTLSKKFVLLK